MKFDYDNNTWQVINNYFKDNKNYLTKHHLDSFNDFVINKIPQTFSQYNPQILYKELDKETKNTNMKSIFIMVDMIVPKFI